MCFPGLSVPVENPYIPKPITAIVPPEPTPGAPNPSQPGTEESSQEDMETDETEVSIKLMLNSFTAKFKNVIWDYFHIQY